MQLDWLFHRDDTDELWGIAEDMRTIIPSQGYRHLSRPDDKEHVANQIGLAGHDISHMALSQSTLTASELGKPVAIDTMTILEIYTVNGHRQAFEVTNVTMDWSGATKMAVERPVPVDPLPF